jgi:hypothetical protein
MTLLLGLDCATLEKKTGLARGTFDGSRLRVDAVALGSAETPVVDTLLHWMEGESPGEDILICIDAPLGWPEPMGELLHRHQAGDPLPLDPNHLFRRETDRFVRRMVGKLPLDVGADRIARTAHKALAILADLRARSGLRIPLPFLPGPQSGVCAIEVYPAATLLAHGFISSGYKGANGVQVRNALLAQVQEKADFRANLDLIAGNDDAFDAVVCLLAGVDFLKGEVYLPTNEDLAGQEGWIWVKKPPFSSQDNSTKKVAGHG